MKYRYIEFTDRYRRSFKNGKIVFVGKPSEELIEELGLEFDAGNVSYDTRLYLTTIGDLGDKGWELQFVTPCGLAKTGEIENSYIFRKECQSVN